jgi:hypothetical protein
MRLEKLQFCGLLSCLLHRRYPSTSFVTTAAVGPSGGGLPGGGQGSEGALVLATPPLAVTRSAEQAVTSTMRLRNMPLSASIRKTFPSWADPPGPAPSHRLESARSAKSQWNSLMCHDPRGRKSKGTPSPFGEVHIFPHHVIYKSAGPQSKIDQRGGGKSRKAPAFRIIPLNIAHSACGTSHNAQKISHL